MRVLLLLTAASWLLGLPILAAAQQKLGEPPEDRSKARQEAIERARHAISAELSVPETRLKLVSAVAAKWPDASLGCPEKDRMYAQVVTRGWKVVLQEDGGRRHQVHVSGRRAVLCSRTERDKREKERE